MLSVLPTTGVANNISEVTVNLVNPFTAALAITQITSTVTSHGISLGNIATTTNFTSAGKSTTTSPQLAFNLNFDPAALFTLTRVLAVEAGEDTTQLDGIVQLGGYSYITATTADAPPSRRELASRELTKRNIYTCVSALSRRSCVLILVAVGVLTFRRSLMRHLKSCALTWSCKRKL